MSKFNILCWIHAHLYLEHVGRSKTCSKLSKIIWNSLLWFDNLLKKIDIQIDKTNPYEWHTYAVKFVHINFQLSTYPKIEMYKTNVFVGNLMFDNDDRPNQNVRLGLMDSKVF